MNSNSIPKNSIVIAWATPVNLAQLGARLEAYAETKAAMTTFRLTARYTTLAALHNLPEEILEMIAGNVRDSIFRRKWRTWTRIGKWLSGAYSSFYAHARLKLNDSDEDGYTVEEYDAAEREAEEQQEEVKWYCHKLSNLDGSSKFAKCVRVFTKDFGIRPYFLLHKFFDYSKYEDTHELPDIDIKHVRAQAFLTLPLPLGPISSKPGPHLASFSIYETVSPSQLTRHCQNPHQRFKLATKALGLDPYDEEWDDTWSQDPSDQFPNSKYDKPSDSETSEDDDDDDDDDEDYYHESDEDDRPWRNCYSTKRRTVTSNQALSPSQETADDEAETKYCPNEDRLAAESGNASDLNLSEKAEEWPQMMVLGCGQFRAWNSTFNYW